jgi:hypothetical protein
MRFFAGQPSLRTVELVDGSTVQVWADSYSSEGEHHTFEIAVELDDGEELDSSALVSGRWPSNSSRFLVAVARFPKTAVLKGGDDESHGIYSG